MVPTILTADMPQAERERWRVVRLDSFDILPGLIVAVDCGLGVAIMQKDGEINTTTYTFGEKSLKIIHR